MNKTPKYDFSPIFVIVKRQKITITINNDLYTKMLI